MEINKVFKKKDSFLEFKNNNVVEIDEVSKQIINILSESENLSFLNNDEKKISDRILKDLKDKNKENLDTKFIIKKNTVAEINSFETKKDIINYLIHRYKYEVFS